MVKNSKKLFIALVTMYYSLFTLVNAASVRATVNTIEVVQGNPVTLRIKATGKSPAFPRITSVGSAKVLSTSTNSSSNWSMVNGSVSSEVTTSKIIRFIPQQDMTIPSYTVNISGTDYKTDSIDIKVVKSSVPASTKDGIFSLKMSANKTRVHVGESFMLTVYFSLRNGVRLSKEVQYTPPTMSDFVVVDAGEQAAYMKGNYQVQEVRYIVTAQSEGNFSITPAQTKVGMRDGSQRNNFFGMTFGTKWYQTASNTVEIEVLPQPQASDLIGSFSVETKIDAQEVKANKPVNLTVRIEGKGNLENFEFPKYEIDGVTIYSDEATVKTKVVDGELFSRFEKSFAFISEEDFVIPERTFTVYDTKEESIKSLDLKSFDIKIKVAKNHLSSATNTAKKGKVQTSLVQTIQTKEVIVEKEVEVETVAWWMLLLAFLAGLLSMYLVRFVPEKKPNPYKESEALKILYAHMSEDSEIEEMVRKLYAKKNGDKSVQIDKKELKMMLERFA